MKTNIKRFLALALAVFMVVSMMPMSVFAAEDAKTVYFTNSLSWDGTICAYAWHSNGVVLGDWPGTAMTYVETNDYGQAIYSVDVPATAEYIIFNNGNNGSQTADLVLADNTQNGYYLDSDGTVGYYTYNTPGLDTEAELIAAIAAGGEVVLGGDIVLTQKVTVSADTTITGPYTITRGTAGTLFAVNKDATLTLDGGVVIDGGNNWTFDSENYFADLDAGKTLSTGAKNSYTTAEEGGIVATAAMITISATNGAVVMNNATIRNSWADNHNTGALFSVPAGATLTMNEGTLISHIRSSVAGQAKGHWIVNGGKITDVHGHSSNGGLADLRGGTFTINGGEFCNITMLGLNANANGILVQVYGESSKLYINGGSFHDNTAFCPGNGWGSVVYLNRGGDFEMNGGVIENNHSDKCTAFVANQSTSVVLNKGTIVAPKSEAASFDSLFYGDVTIGEEMVITSEEGGIIDFLGDAGDTLTINGTINGTVQLMYATEITGTGTVNGDLIVTASDYFEFDGKLTIASGNYLGDLQVSDTGSLTITGGRFADLEAIKYLADGLGLAKNADGTYTVTDQVAEVNGVVYNSVAAAEEAVAAEGGTIKMLAIAPIKTAVAVDQPTVIDLNNNELYATVEEVYPMIRALSDVTVQGVGGVDAMTFGTGYAFIVGNNDTAGTLTLKEGNYYGSTTVASVTKGTLNIEGGYYEATPYTDENGNEYGYRYTLNCIDANYNDGSAVISVTGGTFYGFDPANNLAEGEGTDFVAEKYASTENPATEADRESTWTVSRAYNYVAMVESTGNKYESLAEAVAEANANGTDTVILLQDIELDEKITVTGNVTIEGDGYNIIRANDYTKALFSVPAGATLTLNDMVVDGNNDWTFHEEEYKAQVESGGRVSNGSVSYTTYEEGAPVATETVISIGGNVILNGTTFTDHVGATLFGVANGATLTMNDAVIDHNTKHGSSIVASVSGGGTWTINGETKITNNHNHAGNGTLSYMCGTTIMNGGEISGNTGVDNNGSVFMLYGGSAYFEMNGGIVADNWSLFGSNNGWNPAFYVYGNGATFVMNDGVIENNTSSTVPGIANNGTNGKIEINGGVIRNNDSTKDLNGADLYSYCPVTIEEGVVLTGTARFYGTVENNGTLEGGMYLGGSAVAGGTGTVTGVTCVFANTNVTITDGNYLGDLEVREGGNLTITGGRFADLEAIKYLAPGLGLFKNADGTYTVTDQVAEVGGVVYDSVAAAEAAVTEENTTITMLAIAPIRESVLVDQLTVLDLNNNDLYATVDDVYPMIRSLSDLTVKGEGLVDAVTFGTGYAFIVGSSDTAGELTIQGGNYYTSTTVASVTKGTLNVEGGYYEVTPYTDDNGVEYGYRYTLNCIDANYNDGSAVINVTGGTFYGYDPDNNLAEGEGTDFVPVTHISTEYEATEEGRENTWTVTPDYVCWNMQTGVYYMTVSAGLEEAVSGETVQLLKSTADNYVLVTPGTKLDLNGWTLTAGYVVGFNTSAVLDSTNNAANGYAAQGLLVVEKDNIVLYEGNGAVPVYNPARGGYIFVDFLFNSEVKEKDGVSTINLLVTSRTLEVIDLLRDGANDNDIQIAVRLTWDNETGTAYQDFVFNEETIQNVMQSNDGTFNGFLRMFYVNVTGLEELEGVTATAMVIAGCNAVDAGKTLDVT